MHTAIIFAVEVLVAVAGYLLLRLVPSGEDWDWQQFWLWASFAYILFTPRWWAPIGADELAVRTRFGKPIDVLSAGLPVVPPGFYGLVRLKTLTRQREFPDEPENIYRPNEGETEAAPAGMKPPIRVTFRSAISQDEAKRIFELTDEYTVTRRGKRPEDAQKITFNADAEEDGLNDRRLTTEVTPVVRWRIKPVKDAAIKYVKNIGTEDEVARQLEDELTAVLARICPQISASQAKANMAWLNELLREAAVRRVSGTGTGDDWGIEIEGAYLKPINFNHALNGAIAGVVEALFNKQSTETDARAERIKREQEGAGTAKATMLLEKDKRRGKATGYAAIASATGLTGPEVVQLETAEAMGTADSNTIFAGDTGVGSLAALAGAGFNSTRKKDNPGNSAPQPGGEDDDAN